MAKIKKYIILLVLVLVLIIIALVTTIKMQNSLDQEQQPSTDGEEQYSKIEQTLQSVTDRTEYYAIRDAVNKYYSYYQILFNVKDYYGEDPTQIKQAEQVNAEILYNMLDEEYISENKVTKDNVKEEFDNINKISVQIKSLYVSQQTDNINAYLVQGKLLENNIINNFQIIVKVDKENNTYSIMPQKYVEKQYNDLTEGQDLKISSLNKIQSNKYNQLMYSQISDEIHSRDLFTEVKYDIQFSNQLLYDSLNIEYKSKCFETIELFTQYLQSGRYSKIQLDKYQITKGENYIEYLYIDNNGNNYILNETTPFNYTISLDNYTKPSIEFTKEYKSSSTSKKVVLDIQRFFMGINDKNYGYSYSVLSEGFKNNNYPTKNDFITYANQNFFEQNKVEYIEYETQNDLYIYKIKLTDLTGMSSEEKNFNIIIKLGSETNFEMSFGVAD